jgi:aspartyl-tRNA(Asn)/glutamyl-tRNA(Gln) amidotransferase subunit C
MKITAEAIRHVASLARLEVSEVEVERLSAELSEIIGYAEQLQAVDLNGVEPTSHSLPLFNVFREDVPRTGLSRSQALANAPDTDGEQVRVPAVMEG